MARHPSDAPQPTTGDPPREVYTHGYGPQVEAYMGARARATERGLTNVHFQVGTIYDLPFPAASFDAVYANTVIQHLRDPLRGLREMCRVLVPGGMAGIRDDDWGTVLLEPSTPLLQLWCALTTKVWAHNGGRRPRPLRA